MVGERLTPRLRLGTAFVAAQLPDALWPWFLLAGIERVTIAPGDPVVTPPRLAHYPWLHSLLMVAVWGVAFGLLAAGKAGGRSVTTLALLAVSHWVLDAASHRPDMPLVPWGGPKLGLGLWDSLHSTVLGAAALFLLALASFVRGRSARLGLGFWSLVATLVIVYAMNLFGPPPPNTNAIALSMVVVVPLLWWWANRVTEAAR